MFCSQCGGPVDATMTSCVNCGTPIPSPASSMPMAHAMPPIQPIQSAQPTPATPSQQAPPSVASAQPGAPHNPIPNNFNIPNNPNAGNAAGTPNAPQTAAPNPQTLFAELFSPKTLKTMGASLGIGFAALLVVNIIATLALASAGSSPSMRDLDLDLLNTLSDFNGSTPNMMTNFLVTLIFGLGGTLSVTMSATYWGISGPGVSLDFSMPPGLAAFALLIGAAAGAYMLARKNAIRFKWIGAAASATVGLVSGVIHLLLAAAFTARIATGNASISVSGASFRLFAMAFMFAGLGALAGYALAQYAPDSDNVFIAAMRWMHRTRGPVRTMAESVFIYAPMFLLYSLVAALNFAILAQQWPTLSTLPVFLPALTLYLFSFCSFGGLAVKAPTPVTHTLFSAPDKVLWVGFALFIGLTLVLILRLAARNMLDPAYMGWEHSWKTPVAAFAFWLIASNPLMAVTFGDKAHQASLAPAMWYCLIAAGWAFLIEVVARMPAVGGMAILNTSPLVAGNAVEPTPQPVLDYIKACEAGQDAVVPEPMRKEQLPRNAGPNMPPPAATPRPSTNTNAAPGTTPQMPTPNTQGMPQHHNAPHTSATPHTPATTWHAVVPPITPPLPGTNQPNTNQPGTNQPGVNRPDAPSGIPVNLASSQTNSQPGEPKPTGPKPDEPPADGQPPASATKGQPKRKRFVVALIVIGAILAALGVAYVVLNSTVFSAAATAESYANAIASGDYSKATSMADPKIGGSVGQLLTSEASAKQGTGISDMKVGETRTHGDRTTVRISYRLGDDHVEDVLSLVREGNRFLLFPNWRVETALLKPLDMHIPKCVSELDVNGMRIDNPGADTQDSVYQTIKVYPGTYRISMPESDFITAEPVTLTTGLSGARGTLDTKATDKLKERLATALKEKMEACSAKGDGEGCPSDLGKVFSGPTYRNFSWKLEESPKVDDVNIDSGLFFSEKGKLKISYDWRLGSRWEHREASHSFRLNGTFELKGDSVTISLSNN